MGIRGPKSEAALTITSVANLPGLRRSSLLGGATVSPRWGPAFFCPKRPRGGALGKPRDRSHLGESSPDPKLIPIAPMLDRRLSIAPMMDRTDRHCRYFLRLITRRALLYTEMVPTGAILQGPRARALRFDPAEHPIALQLGGADPAELARAAEFGEAAGYDEVNLNVGCPSDRVQSARFGACLMAELGKVSAWKGAWKGVRNHCCPTGGLRGEPFDFVAILVLARGSGRRAGRRGRGAGTD
jgi:hypothetical protein